MIRKYRSGQAGNLLFWYPKITFFRVFFPPKPPNSHPSPHILQNEPTDLLNLPTRCRISGVQNVSLYYKIDIVIQLFWCLYKWLLAQGLYKTLDPLFLFPIEPEISTPEKSAFCNERFRAC